MVLSCVVVLVFFKYDSRSFEFVENLMLNIFEYGYMWWMNCIVLFKLCVFLKFCKWYVDKEVLLWLCWLKIIG